MSMENQNRISRNENSTEKSQIEKVTENIKKLTDNIKAKLEKKKPVGKEDPEITESVENIRHITNVIMGGTAFVGATYEAILGSMHLLEYNPHFSTDYSDMKFTAVYIGVVMVIEKLASLGIITAVKNKK